MIPTRIDLGCPNGPSGLLWRNCPTKPSIASGLARLKRFEVVTLMAVAMAILVVSMVLYTRREKKWGRCPSQVPIRLPHYCSNGEQNKSGCATAVREVWYKWYKSPFLSLGVQNSHVSNKHQKNLVSMLPTAGRLKQTDGPSLGSMMFKHVWTNVWGERERERERGCLDNRLRAFDPSMLLPSILIYSLLLLLFASR